jgi:uncharacterized membrane protein
MNPIALVAVQFNQLWYALPLVVIVSLVYAATRHEEIGSILAHAVRIGGMIAAFMLIVFVVLLGLAWCAG